MTKRRLLRQLGRPTRNGRAFTLIEIAIVIVVLAILAAVVVPIAMSASSVQVVGAGRMVASDLQYAQTHAISTQSPVAVVFDPASESYQLSNASGGLIHPITNSSYFVDFSGDGRFAEVDIVSADFDGLTSVTFDELGAPDAGGSVQLQAGPDALSVDVANATGKITVVKTGS